MKKTERGRGVFPLKQYTNKKHVIPPFTKIATFIFIQGNKKFSRC